jgi:hypothetical protein
MARSSGSVQLYDTNLQTSVKRRIKAKGSVIARLYFMAQESVVTSFKST